jgi:hypothetical protein
MLISEALVGKYYRSRSRRGLEGIIQYAEKRDNVYTNENEYAYFVTVRPVYNPEKPSTWFGDFGATIYVGVDN